MSGLLCCDGAEALSPGNVIGGMVGHAVIHI